MQVVICACQFYQRTPREKIAAAQATCLAANVACEIIPDLCFASAKDYDKLQKLEAGDVVLACQPRAVRALLENAGNTKNIRCVDLRSEQFENIFDALTLQQTNQPPMELTFEKLSRDWVPWFPVIDTNRCVHCKKCVDFCMFGVYTIEAEKVRVVQPESCKTDCPACARICPQNAIIFPKSEEDRLNGSLDAPVKPSASDKTSFRERLQHRKKLRLFKEDES